ncbi:MAG: Uma2 family endonuclease [Tunicatimonas sp.]
MLSTYVDVPRLGFIGIEKILISLTSNDYEPDVCFFSTEKAQHFAEDQMKFPAPDLVVEVLSASTEARDRGVKFSDYEAHGVMEYWIIDPERETIEQYLLANGSYELRLKAGDGSLRSQAVPGFTISVRAVFNQALNLAEIRKIITEPPPGSSSFPQIR